MYAIISTGIYTIRYIQANYELCTWGTIIGINVENEWEGITSQRIRYNWNISIARSFLSKIHTFLTNTWMTRLIYLLRCGFIHSHSYPLLHLPQWTADREATPFSDTRIWSNCNIHVTISFFFFIMKQKKEYHGFKASYIGVVKPCWMTV